MQYEVPLRDPRSCHTCIDLRDYRRAHSSSMIQRVQRLPLVPTRRFILEKESSTGYLERIDIPVRLARSKRFSSRRAD